MLQANLALQHVQHAGGDKVRSGNVYGHGHAAAFEMTRYRPHGVDLGAGCGTRADYGLRH